MNNACWLFLLALPVLSCTRTEDKQFLVTRIRSAAKLSTMEVVLNKIVVSDMKQNRVLGLFNRPDKAAIFNTEATVNYGIRLDRIKNSDIQIKNDSLKIQLPPVEILNFSYPHENFKEIYPLSTFDLLNADGNKFRTLDNIFRLAELDIREKIELLGLREQAEAKTVVFLEQFLAKCGYYNVSITFKNDKRNG